eukprot:3543966-Prymnesium_polylepis.1
MVHLEQHERLRGAEQPNVAPEAEAPIGGVEIVVMDPGRRRVKDERRAVVCVAASTSPLGWFDTHRTVRMRCVCRAAIVKADVGRLVRRAKSPEQEGSLVGDQQRGREHCAWCRTSSVHGGKFASTVLTARPTGKRVGQDRELGLIITTRANSIVARWIACGAQYPDTT